MNPLVVSVEPLAGYQLKVCFDNGETRVFDVTPYLDKGIFTELKNESYFRQVKVVMGSVEWPNEQDFSHDSLYLFGKTDSQ